MRLKLISAPTQEPLTLAEIKQHLRVTHDDEDDKILRSWKAAREYVEGPEGFLGRALVDQTWDGYLDAFPATEIRIPLPPLIEVMSVNYFNSAGIETSLASTEYTVDDKSSQDYGWIVLNQSASWPTPLDAINAVRVRFRAGYIDLSQSPPVGEVPADILDAILLLTGTLYENRETQIHGTISQQIEWSAEQLLRRRRIDISMA